MCIRDRYSSANDLDKAEEVFNKAKEVSIRLNNMVAQARAIRGLASIKIDRAKFDDALVLMTEATSIAKEVGDKGQIIRCLNGIAVIYSRRGNVHKSIKNYIEMIPIAESLDDKRSLSLANSNLARCYLMMGKNRS